MDILSKLFGSAERVKIMRMFLFNPLSVFGVSDIFNRTGASKRIIESELALFEKSGLAKRRAFPRSYKDFNGKHPRVDGWVLNTDFRYLKPMENLLIQQILVDDREIIKRLKKAAAKLKMVIIAGLFIQDDEGRVDLLVVGDGLRKSAMEKTIKGFEAEIGKEIRYAAFETSEFQYRIGMYDKLVRDIFDYPHRKILDKIGLIND